MLGATLDWPRAGAGANPLDDMVALLAFAETIGQLAGGLPMGQNELLRPSDLGIGQAGRALTDACATLLDKDLAPVRAALVEELARGHWPTESFHEAELDSIRDQFRRFTDVEIIPNAHRWHLANDLIPMPRCRPWPIWAPSASASRRNLAA